MYDFRTLSPLDFEELVRDLLSAELDVRFESFGPGRDLGIDFRFSSDAGAMVVQAKHYAGSGFRALLSAIRSENAKVSSLNPKRYLLATSVSLTPTSKQKLKEAMHAAPVAISDILGKEDLNHLLSRHQEIERRHFKLWLSSAATLDRILHSGVYNRTQAEMEVIRLTVPKFVYNASVPAAQSILDKHRVLIIAGDPGVGKSTLARMLVWLHAEQGWEISVIDDIKEAFEIANEGKKRFIFFDDFLGQVRLSTDFIRSTDQRLTAFLQRVRLGKDIRFVLTTRDYILRQAQAQSERLSSPAVNASQFTLNVGYYTRAAKAQMLFNHVYFSDISKDQQEDIVRDGFFLKIIDHRNFNPRLVQLLTSADYLSLTTKSIREAVEAALDNPQELWEKPYRAHISPEGRALMLSLFFNSAWIALSKLERAFGRITIALGRQLPTAELSALFKSALRELEGSVLAIKNREVSFGNPGIRDFLQRIIVEDRLLDIAIQAATEYTEVKQTWRLFIAQNPSPTLLQESAKAWAMAAKRLRASGSGSALARLSLLIEIFDCLRTEEFLKIVRDATDDLESSAIEGFEADQCSKMLEQLVLTLLPFDIVDRTKAVVAHAIRTMLRQYGDALALDEIKSVAKSLSEWGDGSPETERAVSIAIEAHAHELSMLDDVTSVDELDGYESELIELLEEYGLSSARAERQIAERRTELMERDRKYDGERPTWSPRQAAGWASDEQIKSMFGSLRGS